MWKWRNGHNPINARSLDEKEVLGALVFLPFATIEKEIITSNFPTLWIVVAGMKKYRQEN